MNSTAFVPLFIIAGIIVLMTLIAWISRYRNKERNKKLLREFDDLVIKNNLTIDKRQTLNKNMIGIDRQNMKLLFIDNTKSPHQNHLVNLNDLSACRLIKKRNKRNGYIGNISLQLVFRQKNKPEIIFPVYNESSDNLSKLMRLSKKASYWEKTINLFREVEA